MSSMTSISEILDLIVYNILNVSSSLNPNSNSERKLEDVRNLSACGLISRGFYFASRRYLFTSVTIDIVEAGQYRQLGDDLARILSLHQILVANPLLQRNIVDLQVYIRTYPHRRAGAVNFKLQESGFMSIMALLQSLKTLRVRAMPGSNCTFAMAADVFSTLDVLRLQCPNLHRLELSELANMKGEFLCQWSAITDLKVYDRVNFVSDNPNAVLKMPLERLHWEIKNTRPGDISDTNFVPKLNFSHLRFLRLKFQSDHAERYQILLQMSKGLPVLDELRLDFAFFLDIPPSLSISNFPSLKCLYIQEDIRPPHSNFFRNLSRFFTPRDHTTLNIRYIKLALSAYECTRLVLLDSASEWSRIDCSFSNNSNSGNQYARLTTVDIILSMSERFNSSIDEPGMGSALDEYPASILPLTCASRSVHVRSVIRFDSCGHLFREAITK